MARRRRVDSKEPVTSMKEAVEQHAADLDREARIWSNRHIMDILDLELQAEQEEQSKMEAIDSAPLPVLPRKDVVTLDKGESERLLMLYQIQKSPPAAGETELYVRELLADAGLVDDNRFE